MCGMRRLGAALGVLYQKLHPHQFSAASRSGQRYADGNVTITAARRKSKVSYRG